MRTCARVCAIVCSRARVCAIVCSCVRVCVRAFVRARQGQWQLLRRMWRASCWCCSSDRCQGCSSVSQLRFRPTWSFASSLCPPLSLSLPFSLSPFLPFSSLPLLLSLSSLSLPSLSLSFSLSHSLSLSRSHSLSLLTPTENDVRTVERE